MSECNDGVVLTNDPDHPMVQCQRCGELEAELDRAANEIHRLGAKSSQQEDTIAEAENELKAAEATIAELRVLVDCLPILIRGLKHYGDRQTLCDWDRARRRLEKK